MKKLVLLILALLLIAGSAVAYAENAGGTAVVYSRSGLAEMPKLTQEQIAKSLRDIGEWDKVYTSEPSASAPYAAGELTTEYIQAAVDNITAIRAVAGLPSVYADAELCSTAQHGAVLLAANGVLSHYPGQPQDMDDDFYRRGYSSASSSNIGQGHSNNLHFDRSCMDDDSANNCQTLGHRRWLLNPSLKYVGIGRADPFYTSGVFDKSAAYAEYDFIAWPPDGYCPNELISASAPWSITLNPKVFEIPQSVDNITVRVTRVEDGKSWVLDRNTGAGTEPDSSFFVHDKQGYGVANCFIFRIGSSQGWSTGAISGEFSVCVSGLVNKQGEPAELRYTTTLFTAGDIASEEIYSCGDFSYKLKGDEAEIVGWYGGEKALLIPETLDGYRVTSIADDAEIYRYCTSITLPATLECIGANAFYGSAAIGSIGIPAKVRHIGEYAFAYMSSVTEFIVNGGNQSYCAKDGVLFSKDMTTLINYPLASERGLYVVPESVTLIKCTSFGNAKGLSVLRVPSSVIKACQRSFYGCSLKLYGSDKTELYRQIAQASIEGELSFYPSDEFVEVAQLAIDMPQTLMPGASVPLVCTVSPANATYPKIEWSVIAGSGKAEISDSDKLVAQKAGTVKLRAVSMDGSGRAMEQTIVIMESACTGIELQADAKALFGGDSLQLRVSFTPAEATEGISWSVEGNAAVISDNGLLTAKTKGCVSVTARSESGHTDSLDITIYDFLCGDCDVNGRVEAKDAAELLRHLVELCRLSDSGLRAADSNSNGRVEASDAALILRYLVELEDSLPAI